MAGLLTLCGGFMAGVVYGSWAAGIDGPLHFWQAAILGLGGAALIVQGVLFPK